MEYNALIKHLIDQGCYEDEDGIFDHGSYYHNCVNGDVCYIHKVDYYSSATLCHIFYELKIDAPFTHESDYEVYKLFRKSHEQEMEAQRAQQKKK